MINMNKKLLYIFGLIAWAFLSVACKGDSVTSGESLLGESDHIIVGCDTFAITSGIVAARDIYTTPDSFLLGECDSPFGTIHADILAQFTCPTGFVYPANSEVDSVCLFFYYNSWHGDGNTPMSLSVYEMDKQTFSYATAYSHNINVEDYVTISDANSVLDGKRYLSASKPTDSVYNSGTYGYVPYVRMKLSNDFAKRLFAANDYSSLEAFCNQFKGLYIQSDFGSATLLHVKDINMALYYHFTYNKAGRDTTVNDVKGFYANSEVRQVNRYIYINEDMESLRADSATVNYIVSPANLYTRVSLPIKQMSETILAKLSQGKTEGDVRPYINKAGLSLEVLNVRDRYTEPSYDNWAQPSQHMLLIKESAVDRFFSKREMPSDTCAILGTLVTVTTSSDSTYSNYSYDLSELLTQVIRNIEADTIDVPEKLDMLLVPVSVGNGSSTSNSSYDYYSYYYGYSSSSSSSITSVKHEQTVSATVIRSAQDAEHPLSLEVVYSGF